MIDIVIPTYKRNSRLPSLTKEIELNAGLPFTLYYVVDKDDAPTIATVEELVSKYDFVRLLICPERGSAKAQDYGYRNSTSDYIFTGGDDHIYPKDFLKKSMQDIGDKPVLAIADTETHTWCIFMFKRSYVKEHSLVADMPDSIMFPGYNRIADSELVFTMQHRGVLAYATFTVKHLNPGLYGVARLREDGQIGIESQQYFVYDLRIPYSTIRTELTANPNTGIKNVLRVLITPNNPIVVDDNYTEFTQEAYETDCEVMKSRCHLWGGKMVHDKWFRTV